MAKTPLVILIPRGTATTPAEAQRSVWRHTRLPGARHPEEIVNLMAFLVPNDASFIAGITIAPDGDLPLHFPTCAEELDTRAESLAVMGMHP